MVSRLNCSIAAFTCSLLFCFTAFSQDGAKQLPEGLFSTDAMARVDALKLVEQDKNKAAVGKVATMARGDSIAEVRVAACKALAALDAQDQIELLKYLVSADANAQVRAEAEKTLRKLRGEAEPEKTLVFNNEKNDSPAANLETDEGGPIMPTLTSNEPEEQTRLFGIGFGTMGGFGIASVSMRFRIPTTAEFLPWVGIELGGGWTPPTGYGIISGYLGEITEDDIRWQLISGALGVQLYLHRSHYIPIRGGYDVGQGGYGLFGYGFENLNDEGFFSWGVELGILYHPRVNNTIEKVALDKGKDQPDPWPLVPFMRFVIHFYLV